MQLYIFSYHFIGEIRTMKTAVMAKTAQEAREQIETAFGMVIILEDIENVTGELVCLSE